MYVAPYVFLFPGVGLRPKPQLLVGFGGEAAKTNQKNFSGRRSRPEPHPRVRGDGGGRCNRHAYTIPNLDTAIQSVLYSKAVTIVNTNLNQWFGAHER
jgi:hypothetical protein